VSDRITYVGHATVLLELSGMRLLTDPVLRSRLLHIRRQADEPDPEITERVDAVLISHLHHDHLDFASLRRVGHEVPVVCARGGARALGRRGFRDVTELEPGESTGIGKVRVIATPAEHDGRRYPAGPKVDALGYDIRGGGRRIYFAGDTAEFEGMAELAGGIDVALLPIGGWGPRIGPTHLNPETGAEAAALLGPRIAIPIHWGTLLRVGLARHADRILREPASRFAARVAELAPEVEVAVLEPGESLELPPPSASRG
jgi:L-ascorbate metabolism protein UlaG (beta-lactamase superfamily)